MFLNFLQCFHDVKDECLFNFFFFIQIVEQDIASDDIAVGDDSDNYITNESEIKQKRKGQPIDEDNRISKEFANNLDMSCHQKRIRAPSIPNGSVVKYEK